MTCRMRATSAVDMSFNGYNENPVIDLSFVLIPALSPTPFNRLAMAGQIDCFDP